MSPIAKRLFYDWGGVDLWLFHAINTQSPSWLDTAMVVASQVGNYRNFPLYFGVWVAVIVHLRRVAAIDLAARAVLQLKRFAVGGIFTLLMTAALKLGLDYPRPISVLGWHDIRLLGSLEGHHSLPSGHAAFVMLLALSLWPLITWPYRIGMLVFVAWVGVSRVWLGEHFPADVLAGYAVGLIGSLMAARSIRPPAHTQTHGANHTQA